MVATAHGLTFRVLGPFEVVVGARPVPVGGPRLRAVLARLLVHPGHMVSVGTLVGEVWHDAAPPPDAERTIRTYVSRLRAALGPHTGAEALLVTSTPGYLLRVDGGSVDADRFEGLAGAGRRALAAGRHDEAAEQLAAALTLWRGDAFAEFAGYPALAAASARLARLRINAVEDRIAADLAAGSGADLVTELEALVRAHPERERLWGHLMTALYRVGRQAEALAVFRTARTVLIDEHGIEPSPDLVETHQRILAQDPRLTAGSVASPATVLAPPMVTAASGGRANAPGWPRPAQLPAAVPGFAGRDSEVDLLDGLLPAAGGTAPTAPVVVSGPAGIGKTTLVVHWAHRVASHFPDGHLYVNLRGFDPDGTAALDAAAAARGFLDALGVPTTRVPTSPDALFGLYRSLLAGRRLLVVLDNARDVDHVRPLLPGSPGCLALVTSRNRLIGLLAADGARPLALDVLVAAQSRDVLRGRLGAARIADEPDAVESIVARCGGLPLALSIAAARAAIRPGFPLAALAAHLRESAKVLDTLRGDDDPATDLRAVFSWSYRALSPGAADLFRLLGLPAGPDISTAAAASLAGLPLGLAGTALAELAGASLVTEPKPGRYALHDLLRAYAADLAAAAYAPDERTMALGRLLDHYLQTAHAAAVALHPPFSTIDLPAPALGVVRHDAHTATEAQAWFDEERAALLAAVPQAARQGFEGHAWRLAWSLSRDLDRSGHWTERLVSQQTALVAATRAGDPVGRAHCHRDLGMAYVRLGQDRQAAEHLHHALDLFGAAGDPGGEAHAHVNLSQLTERGGDLHAALEHARQAGEGFRRAGNRAGQAYALNMIGWKLTLLGDHEQAIACCEQALDLIVAAGDTQGEADTWDSLGYAHHHLGRHHQAIECYRRAIDLFDHVGERYGRARCDINLGDTYRAVGDHAAAQAALRRALATLEDLGHPDAEQVRAELRRVSELAGAW